ncbi:MLO-like protein 1 [Phalaenopsis equestris]|uniref:MLO-like protein 1 n=1 Tax=Phalaenopsis equestris TaxID=78828 RepID=UPI0009E5C677|nr:MLO-like protein 1 [Phalaenopsis equestris]
MAEGGGGEELRLDGTPTWIVAVVCTIIVCISLFFERFLHRLGKRFMRKNQKPLFQALQKMKEELMLMGFISLLLVVFQGAIQKICIPESFTHHMRPCKSEDLAGEGNGGEARGTAHYTSDFFAGVLGGGRRLLAGGGSGTELQHCARKGKVPLLSIEAIHQLHIFIFVLATTHVILSVITMLLGSAKIRQWKHWEISIHKETADNASTSPSITHVHQTEFVRRRFLGIGKDSVILSWLHSFFKQIFGSVTKSDYTTMRLGFIMAHCKGNRKFDFHKYMVRALEADFKKVVGISWYLWIFVVIFLLLNVGGWHAYFWISFIPLILLFTVGTKLEHIITQLAHEVAEKNTAIEGDLVVKPSDNHFWFHRPQIVLFLIHLILFQNAFEIAYFFLILTTYGYHSCIMGSSKYIIPRISICVVVQIICSYSTLPLYAIVTQMGSSFKPAIFEEHVQEGLVEWAQKVKMKGRRATSGVSARPKEDSIQLQKVLTQSDPPMQESRVEIVEVDSSSNMHENNQNGNHKS